MSSSAEVYMERERRRRELYLNRIRANVETFLARYETVLAELHAQDLARYVQQEVSHAETCIGLARRALVSDVEQAQAFSFEIGDLLRGLSSYARSRKRGEAAANREAARLAALKEEVQVKRRELSAEAAAARGVAADALKALVARLDATLAEKATAESAETLGKELKEVNHAADEVACDEELRKDTLRALAATMRGLGFVAEPAAYQDRWIRLRFRNASGEKAVFLVDATGALKYSFDGYQGAACKKDRDRVRAQLADVYGVKFSGRRVIQENPDRLEMSSVEATRPENAGC